MSFLIANDKVVAITNEMLKSGELVKYSNQKAPECIDANRDFNLVNAQSAVVSNAKKWRSHPSAPYSVNAVKIAEGEYYTA